MNRLSNNKLTGIVVILILVSLYFGQSILPEIDPNLSPKAADVPSSSQVFINQDDSPHTLLIDGTKVELRLLEASYSHAFGVLLVTIEIEKPLGVSIKANSPRSIIVFNDGKKTIRPLGWKDAPKKILMSEATGSTAQIIRFKVSESQIQGNDLRLEWQNPNGTPAEYPPILFQEIGQLQDSLRYD